MNRNRIRKNLGFNLSDKLQYVRFKEIVRSFLYLRPAKMAHKYRLIVLTSVVTPLADLNEYKGQNY